MGVVRSKSAEADVVDVGAQELAALRGLSAPFCSSRDVIYFENIASEDLPHSSVFGGIRFTDKLRDLIASLGNRQILISDGQCVISPNYRQQVQDYLAYTKSMGLTEMAETDTIIWADPTRTREVFERVKESGGQIEPYMHRQALHQVGKSSEVRLFANSEEVARDVVERFSCKIRYRSWVSERFGDMAIPLPRLSLHGGEKNSFGQLERLHELLDFSARYDRQRLPGELETVLFAQLGIAGGGVGNFRVYRDSSEQFFVDSNVGDPHRVGDSASLLEFLHDLSGDDSLDVTPYVPVGTSFSFGLAITETEAVVIGPFQQILEPGTNAYRGFRLDQNRTDTAYPHFRLHKAIAQEYGEMLRQQGYRGWANEDLFQFVSPDGESLVSRSESNMRRTAPTQLLGFIARHERLSKSFEKGALSILQCDHMEFSAERVPHLDSAQALARALSESGFSLVSRESPYGVLLLTGPIALSGGRSSFIGAVIAPTDKERDSLYDGVQTFLKSL